MKRKEKVFRYWIDILFKIFLFIAAIIALKLVMFPLIIPNEQAFKIGFYVLIIGVSPLYIYSHGFDLGYLRKDFICRLE